MIYNSFRDISLSALGMGCMRLPVKGNNPSEIDVEKTREMIETAINSGVNYFDTAWGYHNGESEKVIGEILQKYPREKFYLASKYPGYDLSNFGKNEKIFEKQLEKCRVDYFDFYLFHNVNELNIDKYLDDEQYKTYTYLTEEKKKGRIRHLGFSCHGSIEVLKKFLDKYGKDMEFCQLQINWLDWKFQKAEEKVKLLKEYNIPVWVMEPVRGGKLANLPAEYFEELKEIKADYSPAEWAFRFIQGIPEVIMTLSGMNNLEQIKDNLRIFSERKPLTSKETELLFSLGEKMTKKCSVPCTSCRYCTEKCKMQIDIPRIIELYNENLFENGGFLPAMAIKALDENKRPSACLNCKSCEKVCPQNIKISEIMKDFAEKLNDNPFFKR